MKLNFNNRYFKFFEEPIDITIIEIRESDKIYKYIEFLDYDINYIRQGYIIYKDADIFSLEHPYGEDIACASGKLIKIYNYEFDHNIPTEKGSSGCPILLLSKNINLIQIIGVHKNSDRKLQINGGTFIGEVINALNQNLVWKISNLNMIINNNSNYLDSNKHKGHPYLKKDINDIIKKDDNLKIDSNIINIIIGDNINLNEHTTNIEKNNKFNLIYKKLIQRLNSLKSNNFYIKDIETVKSYISLKKIN